MPILLTLISLGLALVYTRGWIHLSRTLPHVIPASRLVAFLGGLFSVWIALASPLSALDDDLLIVHMAQHLLLMTVAAPLILLGAPAVTLLHGLPSAVVRTRLGPLLRSPLLKGLADYLTRPGPGWLAGTVVVIGWHIPALFELAL